MKKYLFVYLIFLLSMQTRSQDVIQLIGVECDNSSLSEGSYSVMYDNSNDVAFKGKYIPYQTIGVVRKGDDVKLLLQNYLIVPTAQGFKYATQSVGEEPNDTTSVDLEMEFEKHYLYRSSYTVPRFFTNKKKIQDFISSQKPSFEDAIQIHYEKISFITPNFYITEGFESEVHGGATWFNATEISKFYKLNPKLEVSSNRLPDYLDRSAVNRIIKEALKDVYGENESVNDDDLLPWAGPLGEHDEVYFTLVYLNNRVKVIPLTLLHGNSARAFLAMGEPFSDKSLLDKLKVKEYGDETKGVLEFVSPDLSTRTQIEDQKIEVYDNKDNRLLLEKTFPPFNRIVMSEWALGRFVDSWTSEF